MIKNEVSEKRENIPDRGNDMNKEQRENFDFNIKTRTTKGF